MGRNNVTRKSVIATSGILICLGTAALLIAFQASGFPGNAVTGDYEWIRTDRAEQVDNGCGPGGCCAPDEGLCLEECFLPPTGGFEPTGKVCCAIVDCNRLLASGGPS